MLNKYPAEFIHIASLPLFQHESSQPRRRAVGSLDGGDGMGWRVNEAKWSAKLLSSHPRDAHRDAMQCNAVGIHMLAKMHFNIGSVNESQIGCLQLNLA